MNKTYVIDRFEGDFAVCEDVETLETLSLRREELPGADAGDVIVRREAGFEIDRAQTEARKERIKSLFERLKR